MRWLVLILRDARTRVRSLPNVFGVRAPQDEDEHRVVHSSRFQTANLVLATRWRPRLATFASLTPNRGVGGAPRDVRVLGEAPVRRIMTRYARRLARRLASHDAGRSPLGAPPWRFWAPGPRFSHRHLRRIGYSELLAPRS